MSKFSNLRNRPFLIVRTIQRVARAADGVVIPKTHVKGWGDNRNHWTLFENISVHDRVSDKNLREATVIVDIMRGEVVSHRFGDEVTDDEVASHYIEKYRDECKQAIDVWLTKVATKMAKDPNYLATQAQAEAMVAEKAETSEGTEA